MAITRKGKTGNERAFEESLREFFQSSLDHQGVLGVHLISPPPSSNSREYGIQRIFTSEHERELHGLEAWFHRPGAPPRWKMALLTWLGVWRTSWLVGTLIGPRLSNFPTLLSSAIVAAAIVVCLTWIVMPAVVKVFHSWLH